MKNQAIRITMSTDARIVIVLPAYNAQTLEKTYSDIPKTRFSKSYCR
jgi:hypothetical protein